MQYILTILTLPGRTPDYYFIKPRVNLNFNSTSNPSKSELGMNQLDRCAFYLLLPSTPSHCGAEALASREEAWRLTI